MKRVRPWMILAALAFGMLAWIAAGYLGEEPEGPRPLESPIQSGSPRRDVAPLTSVPGGVDPGVAEVVTSASSIQEGSTEPRGEGAATVDPEVRDGKSVQRMTPTQRRLAALRTKTFLLEERKDVASAKSVVQTAIMAKMDAAGTGTPLPEDGKMPKNEPGWIWFAEGRHLYRFQVGEFPLYAELQSRRGHVGPLERDLLDQVRAEGLLAQALLEQYVSEGK